MCAKHGVNIDLEKRRSKRKKLPGETADDDGFQMSPQQIITRLLNEVLDNLIAEMNRRFEGLVAL